MKRIWVHVAMLATLSLAHALGSPSHPAIVRAEFIHEPQSYPQCHASTLVETSDGSLVAAWFGGTRESHPDVSIWVSRRENGTWTPEVNVADGMQRDRKRYPCWNPVLFQPTRGPLQLFYKVGASPQRWWGMVITSTDGGRTWSEPRRLPEHVLGPIKNKPIELVDGTWLSGSSTEDRLDGWRVHLERSSDQGKSWNVTESLDGGGRFNAIQPAILVHSDSRFQLLCRSKEMTIATSWSSDTGRTWTPLQPSGLFAPNSGIDAVTLKDGRHIVVYNHRDGPKQGPGSTKAEALGGATVEPAEANENWGVRWPLDIAISADGTTWKHIIVLEDEPLKDGYAYPAVIQSRDGLVHVSYTWGRVKIKHVVLDPGKF
ncbi:MAG: sialidase family protein [Opitutus sp.]